LDNIGKKNNYFLLIYIYKLMIYASSFKSSIDSRNSLEINFNNKCIFNNISTPVALSIIKYNNGKSEPKPIKVIEVKEDYIIPDKYMNHDNWMMCLPKINGNDIDFSSGYCFQINLNNLSGIITVDSLCDKEKLIKKPKTSPKSPSKSSSSRSSGRRPSLTTLGALNPISPN
jgi:hypothetical protein